MTNATRGQGVQGALQREIEATRAALLERDQKLLASVARQFGLTEQEISRLIGKLNVMPTVSYQLRHNELLTLQQQVVQLIDDAHRLAFPVIERARQFDVLQAGIDLERLLGVQGLGTGINVDAVVRTFGAVQKGTPLARLLANASNDAGAAAKQQLFNSVVLGENPRLTAARLGKVMNISTNRASTIARTEVMRAYRGASQDAMQMSDSVEKWIWISDRGANTCELCWAMDGTLFDTEEEMDTHPNCRCSMAPVPPDSMVDLGNGPDIFDGLSDAEQLDILGPGKFALYNKSEITLQDLVVHGTHAEWGGYRRSATLAELK